MRELLVATKNPGKFKEICEALEGINFELVSLEGMILDDADFVEDGETFEENAKKKAKYYYEKLKGRFEFVLGEDSGIRIDALSGELGVKTRRWGAGEKASDAEWIDYFLKRMEGVPEIERGAEFVCCAYIIAEGEERVFRGETEGLITHKLEAPVVAGIPLSSCFKPNGLEVVYAALSVEQKNKISHRGKALSPLKSFLETL